MKTVRIVVAVILIAAGRMPAATVMWGGIEVSTQNVPQTILPTIQLTLTSNVVITLPTVLYHGVMVAGLPLLGIGASLTALQVQALALQIQTLAAKFPNGIIPLTVLRTMSLQIQALSVSTLLDRWIKLYGLLKTPRLYKGNHFAVEAQAIERQAQTEGVTDAILTQCAAFAADLKAAEGVDNPGSK